MQKIEIITRKGAHGFFAQNVKFKLQRAWVSRETDLKITAAILENHWFNLDDKSTGNLEFIKPIASESEGIWAHCNHCDMPLCS